MLSQVMVEQQQQQQQQQVKLHSSSNGHERRELNSKSEAVFSRNSSDTNNTNNDATNSNNKSFGDEQDAAASMLSLQPISMPLIASVLLLESPQHLDATTAIATIVPDSSSSSPPSTKTSTNKWNNTLSWNSNGNVAATAIRNNRNNKSNVIVSNKSNSKSKSNNNSNNNKIPTKQCYKRATCNYVYLLPRSWMINWLVWANHQTCAPEELPHKQALFTEICELLKLDHNEILNFDTTPYTNPGPIDASSLSLMGHPLLLKPNTVFGKGTLPEFMQHQHQQQQQKQQQQQQQQQQQRGRSKTKQETSKVRRSSSLSGLSQLVLEAGVPRVSTTTTTSQHVITKPSIGCCAISESCYDYIKSIHGVRCNDFQTVSFQSNTFSASDVILHHHEYKRSNNNNINNSYPRASAAAVKEQQEPKPIEFRRRVIHGVIADVDDPTCTRSIVEIYPIKLTYTVMESAHSPLLTTTATTTTSESFLFTTNEQHENTTTTSKSPTTAILSNNNNNDNDDDDVSQVILSPRSSTAAATAQVNYKTILQNAVTKLSRDKAAATIQKKKYTNTFSSMAAQTPDSNRNNNSSSSYTISHPSSAHAPHAITATRGFVLLSRTMPMDQAVKAILQVVAADKSIDCKRCWASYSFNTTGATTTGTATKQTKNNSLEHTYDATTSSAILSTFSLSNVSSSSTINIQPIKDARNSFGTEFGDGYELWTDLFSPGSSKSQTVEEFLQHLIVSNMASSLPSTALITTTNMQQVKYNVILETRQNSIKEYYSRRNLELCNKIQVGDFVDAPDNYGKWYEAIVREVTDDRIQVHFIGWGSRWDSWIRRYDQSYYHSESPNYRLRGPPAPLWSRTKKWRCNIKVGSDVEVREVASLVQRPKWFPAKVLAVGRETDPIRSCEGGAQLEALEPDDPNNSRQLLRPLLLLNRTRQVLVEVPKENFNSHICAKRLPKMTALLESNGPTPNPPYIRWVQLYGEEICDQYTHNPAPTSGIETVAPATIRYDVEASRKPVEVLQTFNNVYGAGFVRESIRGIPPAPGSVGLHNLGNSCFLNSILQCLNHIEPLTRFFLSGDYKMDLNKTNALGSGGIVARAYAALLNDMWCGEYSTLAPRSLKTTVALFAPQFNNCFQHDSQEFCSFLMDGLHEDLNRVIDKPYIEEMEGRGLKDDVVAMESWRRHLLRHDSVIVDHCQGMHRSHLTCPDCGHESVKFDVFSTISLPIPVSEGKKQIPLSASLESFTSEEELDEENAWYCGQCQKHVCAKKRIALWSTPDILILHLKRFTFNTCKKVEGRIVRSKVETKVDFPVDGLNMSPYVIGPIDEEFPPIYNLFGVSEHQGSTANSGHYTATVRNSKDGNWYRYNDSHVGRTSGDASITGGAYVLFYQRQKGKNRWAGMEKALLNKSVSHPSGAPNVDVDGFQQVKTKKGRKKKGA